MRLATVTALALLVAAGCVSDTHSVSPVAARPGFVGNLHVIDPAQGQGEPSLGIAPDGTLYANRGGTVYQSKDNGTTWKDLGDPTAPMPDEDADLVVDRDGTIWDDTLYLGCSTVAVSRDSGASWSVNQLACVPAAGDRQYVVPTSNGTAYIYSHHVPTFYQAIAKTTDYGATWVPVGVAEGPLAPAVPGGESGWGGGGFWNARTGTVYLTFSWFDNIAEAQAGAETTAWHPAVSLSRDGGATWTMTLLPTAGGQELGLSLVTGAADSAGNAYVTWAEAKGKDTAVYMAVSRDDGRTWAGPMLVDGDAGSKVFPETAALAPGHVAVAYYHADQHEYPSRVPATTHWNVTVSYTEQALAPTPAWTHANLSQSPLRTGAICPDGTLCGVINCPSGSPPCADNRDLLDYFALHATPDGRVASVWASTDDVPGHLVNVFAVTHDPVLAG